MSPELQQHIAKKKRVKAAKDAMVALIDATNIMGCDDDIIEGMLEGMVGSHRTLQQSSIRCFVGMLKGYSECRTDARNENAVEFAKKVSKMETHFSFI